MPSRRAAYDLLFRTATAHAVPEFADDDRIVNELHGFLSALRALSDEHRTDDIVDLGTVQVVAGSPDRMQVLVHLAERLGLIERAQDCRDLKAYRLVGGA